MKKKTLIGNYQRGSYSPNQRLLNKGYEEVATQIAQDLVSGICLREDHEYSLKSMPSIVNNVKYALLANNGAAIQSLMRHIGYKYS